MKKRFLLLALAAAGLGVSQTLRAEDESSAPLPPPPAPEMAPAEKSPIMGALEELIGTISGKLREAEGKLDPEQLAPELAQFEALVAKYPDAKEEERAGVMWAKALLYIQVFEDFEGGAAIVKSFKTDFPGTEFAAKSDEILGAIERDRQSQALRADLVVGAVFPGFEGKDLAGAVVSTAALKGKVVLVDFWATWCPPCVAEIPSVVAAYGTYHAKGFEVIGISLDRDEAELKKFIEEQKMPWPQIFGDASDLAGKFGVESIPTTYLIDAEGKIAATDLRGDDLANKLGELLGKE